MRIFFDRLIDVILIVAVVAVVGLVVRREFGAPRSPILVSQADSVKLSTVGNDFTGASDEESPRILVFLDYTCGICAEANSVLGAVSAAYPGTAIRLANYPLDPAPNSLSMLSALGAHCASVQGKFASFHDLLFANNRWMNGESLATLAERAKMPNVDAFMDCLGNPEAREAVLRERMIAEQIGVRSTPTFVIGRRLHRGFLSFDILSKAILE